MLASRCMAPHSLMTKRPAMNLFFHNVEFNDGETFGADDAKLYGYGPCFFHAFQRISRAGFAVVQVSPEGNLLRGIYGCMPKSPPQTSLAGEYGALPRGYDNNRGGRGLPRCNK